MARVAVELRPADEVGLPFRREELSALGATFGQSLPVPSHFAHWPDCAQAGQPRPSQPTQTPSPPHQWHSSLATVVRLQGRDKYHGGDDGDKDSDQNLEPENTEGGI